MPLAVVKKPCSKCSNDVGVATCDGCQQSLCVKHFIEHRDELSRRIQDIGREHDFLQGDLNKKNVEHPLFFQINTWERDSINKIKSAAEVARADLRELLDRSKTELKESFNNLTNELQSCLETHGYTEIDINKWTEELQAFRATLESPPIIRVDENATSESMIRMIRVRDQQQDGYPIYTVKPRQYFRSGYEKSAISSSDERFDVVDGDGIVSEEGLLGTCDRTSTKFVTIIYGRNQYSSGIHRIHFRIEKIGDCRIFLGISRLSRKVRKPDGLGQPLCGWWDLNKVIVNGWAKKVTDNKVITTGDRITLILDCDNREIQLHHHRTDRRVQLTTDLKNCPFPWRVVVMLQQKGDSIRIVY